MSSIYVRTQFKSFLSTNLPSENVVDLTAQHGEIKDVVQEAGVAVDSPWLGLQFIGDDEIPIGLAATNDQGLYRESGAVYFHFVDIAKIGNGDSLLTRGETLRDLLRGQRIGDIIIESVSPMNFDAGATLAFDGGFMSGSFIVSYYRDLNL